MKKVRSCPVCKAQDPKVLFTELGDITFGTNSGVWDLAGCNVCGSAYLNPLPSSKDLAMAYERYYTHDANLDFPKKKMESMKHFFSVLLEYLYYGSASQLRSFLDNYAWQHPQSFVTGQFMKWRFLPAAQVENSMALDIGFGDGAFLRFLRKHRYVAYGVESDPHLVMKFENIKGYHVYQNLEQLSDKGLQFDYISLNHVIEHVQDPRETLISAYSLLKKGGVLYIETPNIDSDGFLKYGECWRGLEVPRHLQIFCMSSLQKMLFEIGRWQSVRFTGNHRVRKKVFSESEALSRSHSNNRHIVPARDAPPTIESEHEFLSVLCEK